MPADRLRIAVDEETSGILNNETLNAMPRGAYVTSIGRGGHSLTKICSMRSTAAKSLGLSLMSLTKNPCRLTTATGLIQTLS